jgi:hypothetical protein
MNGAQRICDFLFIWQFNMATWQIMLSDWLKFQMFSSEQIFIYFPICSYISNHLGFQIGIKTYILLRNITVKVYSKYLSGVKEKEN